jgi:endonuclease/exonuclease/phosphatase family metal-dependent hydrolase
MNITAVQWNIGGGKIFEDGKDPLSMYSYNQEGLGYIIEFLKKVSPDIITLQEVHQSSESNQADVIARELGLGYCASDFYADSHVEEGQRLGHAIISRYPISNKSFELFVNLNKEMVAEDGSIWHMHDKGYTRCTIDVDGSPIETTTTHLSPLSKFGVAYDSGEGQYVLNDVQNKLLSQAGRQLIQADFNLDSVLLAPVLPALITGGLNEVPQENATTPKGRHYDHVLYEGMNLIQNSVDSSVLTDHYPVVTKFSF